jgi:hypothetical protein
MSKIKEKTLSIMISHLKTGIGPSLNVVCVKNVSQIMDNVRYNCDVTNRPLSQTFRECILHFPIYLLKNVHSSSGSVSHGHQECNMIHIKTEKGRQEAKWMTEDYFLMHITLTKPLFLSIRGVDTNYRGPSTMRITGCQSQKNGHVT